MSVFQSLPDSWAIDQLFPIMPLHRLDERPTRSAVLADITCDSDGKIDRFVSQRDIKRALEVHELVPGEEYYLGAFLVGAYQETLGDLHNLFGDTHVVHIRLDDEHGWWIEEIVKGDTASAGARLHAVRPGRALPALRARLRARDARRAACRSPRARRSSASTSRNSPATLTSNRMAPPERASKEQSMSMTHRIVPDRAIAAVACLAAFAAAASEPARHRRGDPRDPRQGARGRPSLRRRTARATPGAIRRRRSQFFGLRQDMTVIEVWPGGGGWYTEVLAPVLREHGRYIAASLDPKSTSEYVQDELEEVRRQARGAPGPLRPRRGRPRCRRRTRCSRCRTAASTWC